MQTMVGTQRRSSCSGRLTLILVVLFLASAAKADVLFEGYSKILIDGVHVGYTVQRYEFDPKKKEFSTISFLKTNALGGNITESLKARSNAKFQPISFSFTSLVGDQPKTIDATFKGDTMTAKVKDGAKKPETIVKKIPKEAFLASFLGYVMLNSKEGLKTGLKYTYKAVAEEDAGLYGGEAYVAAEEPMNGVTSFKILNKFKGAEFASWVTHKGEIITTKSPAQKLATELVATVKEATEGQQLNSVTLSQLFGAIPKGVENAIARRGSDKPIESSGKASPEKSKQLEGEEPAEKSKTKGVPGGQGVMIKGAPPKEEAKEQGK